MTRTARIASAVLALVVAIAAFVILRPAEDEPEAANSQPAATATADADADGSSTPEPAATATPEPLPLLSAEKVRRIRVEQGDTVRFEARSQTDDEIHVHGYDHSKAAPAGKKVRMSFKADITGIFEIELEHAGIAIGELEVRP